MGTNYKRIVALILDLIVIGIFTSILSNFIALSSELGTFNLFGQNFTYGLSFLFVAYLAYFIIFDIFNKSISIGKMIMKINIIFNSNEEIGLKSRVYRSLLKVISILFIPISAIIFLINGFTIQDYLCGTITVENSLTFSE